MILVHDLGRIYPTAVSKQKHHYAIVECPICGERTKAMIPRALKPAMCIKCFRAQKDLPPINTQDLPMRLVKDLGKQYPTATSKQKTRYGIFECSKCKRHIRIAVNDVRKQVSGNLCLKCYTPTMRENMKTHGDSKGTGSAYESLYRRWHHMRSRCNNPKDKAFINYGGRGIIVCETWNTSYELFKDWALANGYQETLTIDRIDNSKGYYPENCRWVTSVAQARNRHNQ